MKKSVAALPNNLQQWANVCLAAALTLLIFILGLSVVQHQADVQFITRDELEQNLQQLQSYSTEAALLAKYSQQASAPHPYTEAYASTLQEATDSISKKLNEHAHLTALDAQIATTIGLANKLSEHLTKLSTEPSQQMRGMDQQLQNLGDQLEKAKAAL